MKLKLAFVFFMVLMAAVGQAQDKWYTKSARISFFSSAPLEDITARNKSAVAVLDTKTGLVQFSVLIKGFEFENAEMQEHFNENYLESDKYPKSEFKGQVINNGGVNYAQPGTYPVQVKGQLTIHGVTKEVQTPGTIKVAPDGVTAQTTFTVQVADYNIKIPALVRDKIAKTVKIMVDASLNPLK